MAKLKYDVETDASWEENLYHEVVKITNGVVESDDPLTIESLLYRGFSLVEDAPAPNVSNAEAVATE